MSDTKDLVQRLRAHVSPAFGSAVPAMHEAADTIERLTAERDALTILLGDMASALEYHQELTRPIHSTKVALDAYRAARTGSKA